MLDPVTDRNRVGFYKIAQLVTLPDFVKEAQLPETADVAELRADVFADSRKRLYPMDSRENTWLSCAYFEKYGSQQYNSRDAAKIKGRLMESAKFWDFAYPEFPEKQAGEERKIQYRMGDRVFVETVIDGAEDLYKVAEDLQKRAGHYPYAMRRSVARQVLVHAAALDVEMPKHEVLEKTAGYAVATVASALQLLKQRQGMLERPEAQTLLKEAIETVESSGKGGLLTPGMTDKIARLADVVDRLAGQHVRYGAGNEPPEQQLFSLTLSQMEDFHKNAVHLANGTVLTPDEVSDGRIRKFLHNYTGEKVAVDEVREKLETLNSRASDLVVGALRS